MTWPSFDCAIKKSSFSPICTELKKQLLMSAVSPHYSAIGRVSESYAASARTKIRIKQTATAAIRLT